MSSSKHRSRILDSTGRRPGFPLDQYFDCLQLLSGNICVDSQVCGNLFPQGKGRVNMLLQLCKVIFRTILILGLHQ
jgi:hypothetical protein